MLALVHHQINYAIPSKNTKINLFTTLKSGIKLDPISKKNFNTNYYLVLIRGGSLKKIEKKIIPNVLINKNV